MIGRYLRAARREKMLLDPRHPAGLRAVHARRCARCERCLKEPDVSLALDPEWSLEPPVLPGQAIGSTDAATVNEVSAYLSRIVRENDLPEKLLVRAPLHATT